MNLIQPLHSYILCYCSLFGKFLSIDQLTFCTCTGLNCFCWSYSSWAHRWYINGINGINSQVGQYCGVWRVVHTKKVEVILWSNWVVSDSVTEGFSLKIFLWKVTPSQGKTRWTLIVGDDQIRSSKRSWDKLKKKFLNQKIGEKLQICLQTPVTFKRAICSHSKRFENLNTCSSQK